MYDHNQFWNCIRIYMIITFITTGQIRQGKYFQLRYLEEKTQAQRGELACMSLYRIESGRSWVPGLLTACGMAQVPTGSAHLYLKPLHHYKITCKSGKFLFLTLVLLLHSHHFSQVFSMESGRYFMVQATQRPHLAFSFSIFFFIEYFCGIGYQNRTRSYHIN